MTDMSMEDKTGGCASSLSSNLQEDSNSQSPDEQCDTPRAEQQLQDGEYQSVPSLQDKNVTPK